MAIRDIVGQKFNRLTVTESLGTKNRAGEWLFSCMCDCGNSCITSYYKLSSGRKVSCGCYAREMSSLRATKHGRHQTKIYVIWQSMVQRCSNPLKDNYDYYGGRGIDVCQDWKKDGTVFINWAISIGYREGMSLDRIANDKGYSPENCRFINKICQNLNKRIDNIKPKKDSPLRPYPVYIGLKLKSYYFGSYATEEEALMVRKQIATEFVSEYGSYLDSEITEEIVKSFVTAKQADLGVKLKPHKTKL